MIDDLYLDLDMPSFEDWKKELDGRGMEIEVLELEDVGQAKTKLALTVSRMCTIMDRHPGHVVVPNPGGDPEVGVGVILVPEELAEKILVLGEIVSRR
jgi:hypothetical protein